MLLIAAVLRGSAEGAVRALATWLISMFLSN
jgi:hypothetical protein